MYELQAFERLEETAVVSVPYLKRAERLKVLQSWQQVAGLKVEAPRIKAADVKAFLQSRRL